MGLTGQKSFPEIFSCITGLETSNEGVSAQISTQVSARQGGTPATFVLIGGTLPSEGSVAVAPVSISPVHEHWTVIEGSLAGVSGKLERLADKTHRFYRSEPGDPVRSSEPVEFRSHSEFVHDGKLAIFWTVRGNYLETDQVVADTAASIKRLGHDRYLVIGALNIRQPGHDEFRAILALNQKLSETFGDRFVDVRSFIIAHERRRFDAGAKLSNQCFELNNVPARLRVDVIHFNDRGNQLLSLLVAAHLEKLCIMRFPEIHEEFEKLQCGLGAEEALASLNETHGGQLVSETTCADPQQAQTDAENTLRNELNAARQAVEAAHARAASIEAISIRQREELATARSALESMQGLRDAQSEAIASLTRRLESEITRADDLRRVFQAQERDLRAQIIAREHAFATLVGERDELMARFREHIVHYDALRDELDHRTAADDETYEQVLQLAARIRSFADRWSAMPATGQAETSLAAQTLQELSSGLLAVQTAMGGLAGIAADLEASQASGNATPTLQPAR